VGSWLNCATQPALGICTKIENAFEFARLIIMSRISNEFQNQVLFFYKLPNNDNNHHIPKWAPPN